MKQLTRKRKARRNRAHWINDKLICDCGSELFTVLREKVQHKVHKKWARRRRRVGVCENGHKSRIGFPTKPRQK